MQFNNFKNGCDMIFGDGDCDKIEGTSSDEIFDAYTIVPDGTLDNTISIIKRTVIVLSNLDNYVTFRALDLIEKGNQLLGVVMAVDSDDENLTVSYLNENEDEVEATFGLEALEVKKIVFDQKTYKLSVVMKFDGLSDDNTPIKFLLIFDNYDDDRENPAFQDKNGNCILS